MTLPLGARWALDPCPLPFHEQAAYRKLPTLSNFRPAMTTMQVTARCSRRGASGPLASRPCFGWPELLIVPSSRGHAFPTENPVRSPYRLASRWIIINGREQSHTNTPDSRINPVRTDVSLNFSSIASSSARHEPNLRRASLWQTSALYSLLAWTKRHHRRCRKASHY